MTNKTYGYRFVMLDLVGSRIFDCWFRKEIEMEFGVKMISGKIEGPYDMLNVSIPSPPTRATA